LGQGCYEIDRLTFLYAPEVTNLPALRILPPCPRKDLSEARRTAKLAEAPYVGSQVIFFQLELF